MTIKPFALIAIIIFALTVTLYGDVTHAVDPRGKIENITGTGEFILDMSDRELADFKEEGKETGQDFTIRNITWKITGGDQDWVFTRITQLGEDNQTPTIKRERFRISILKSNGVWITRTNYRFREGQYKEGDTDEVGEKDEGRKFSARCRITGKKIVLVLNKQKQSYIFKITKKDGLIQVNEITTQDLRDWTMNFKKRE